MPNGSVYDYYNEISKQNVEISGTIEDRITLPKNYQDYHNNSYGWGDYGNNAQNLIEDAVQLAIAKGVKFNDKFDVTNDGNIDTLIVIHSGRDAGNFTGDEQYNHLWSYCGETYQDILIPSSNLKIKKFIICSHDDSMGTFAHEVGHLIFQWDDFYDIDYQHSGGWWDGTGDWDLMGNGCNTACGVKPVHPAGLHKMQHEWINVDEISGIKTKSNIILPPLINGSGKLIKIISPMYNDKQFLLLENRVKEKFDENLPGEGLLIWRIDLEGDMREPNRPSLLLIQADRKNNLAIYNDGNQGDKGDPFPGESKKMNIDDSDSVISTSFLPKKSGIFLTNIQQDINTKVITFELEIKQYP